jgi:predicted transcriptional regulator
MGLAENWYLTYSRIGAIMQGVNEMDRQGVITKLRRRLRGTTQQQVADDLGISQSLLCDVLRGYREPTDRLLAPLGLRKVVTYRPL